MKEEIRFKYFSSLSVVEFYATKELVNMMKEAGLDTNPKGEVEDYSLT